MKFRDGKIEEEYQKFVKTLEEASTHISTRPEALLVEGEVLDVHSLLDDYLEKYGSARSAIAVDICLRFLYRYIVEKDVRMILHMARKMVDILCTFLENMRTPTPEHELQRHLSLTGLYMCRILLESAIKGMREGKFSIEVV